MDAARDALPGAFEQHRRLQRLHVATAAIRRSTTSPTSNIEGSTSFELSVLR